MGILWLCLVGLILSFIGIAENAKIAFVYTSIPGSCGPFSDIAKAALAQTIAANNEVILISNFKQCRWALADLKNVVSLKSLSVIESVAIKSSRTANFEKAIKGIIPKNDDEYTVAASLYRYFMLEDYMKNSSVGSLLSMNLNAFVYNDLSKLLLEIHNSNSDMAVMPFAHKRLLSSSVMWIGNIAGLHKYTSFLMDVFAAGVQTTSLTTQMIIQSTSKPTFSGYLQWIREFGCCRTTDQGGIFPDDNRMGLHGWAFGDMSLLAYYRHLHRKSLDLIPLFSGLSEQTGIPPPSALVQGGLHRQPSDHHGQLLLYERGGHEVLGITIDGVIDVDIGGLGRCYSDPGAFDYHGVGSLFGGSVSPVTTTMASTSASATSEVGRSHATRSLVEVAMHRHNCTVGFYCAKRLMASAEQVATYSCSKVPFLHCSLPVDTFLSISNLFASAKDDESKFTATACLCEGVALEYS